MASSEFAKQAADIFQSLAVTPSIESGLLLEGGCVMLKLSQTDVANAKKRAFLAAKALIGEHPHYQVVSFPFPCDLTNVTTFAPSPSGKQLGLVRVEETKKDEPTIEVVVECACACNLVF